MTAKVKSKTIDVFWMWARNGVLLCEYTDNRKMSEIVKDWENAEKIERFSETEGNLVFEGYTKIQRVIIMEDRVQIALVREGV